MEENSIYKLMVQNHYKIDQVLNNFEKREKSNSKESFFLFDQLKWELEKHFFTEEKAIFAFLRPSDYDTELISRLVKEHDIILEKLNEISSDVHSGNDINLVELKRLLQNHRIIEENNFYIHLDEKLDDDQKKFILQKVNEVFKPENTKL